MKSRFPTGLRGASVASMFRLIAHPLFGRLFATQVVALVGTGLLTVALGLLAYELAGGQASVVLGTAYAIKMVAYVGLAPLAAAALAHVPRKTVLIGADVIRAAVALSLPFLSEVWQIYIAIFVLQAASASFTPAFQAVIPDILTDEDDYTQALSLSRLAYDLESLVSPLLAAVLLSVVSFHWLFAGTALGFVASGMIIAALVLPAASGARRQFRDRLTRGAAIYLATPRLRGLLAVTLTAAASSAFVITNTVTLVRADYGGSDGDVALALGAYGLGSMAMAFALPQVLRRFGDRPVMFGGAAGLMLMLGIYLAISMAAQAPWSIFLIIWAVFGAGFAATLTPAGRLITRSAQHEDRPAVFTAQFALSHGMWLVTYPLAGFGLAYWGLVPALLVTLGVAVLGLGAAWRVWPQDSGAPLAHSHPELPADHPHLAQHAGGPHRHPIIIDDVHPHWPTQG